MLRKLCISGFAIIVTLVCAGAVLLSGCGTSSSQAGSPVDQIAQQGLYYGLWAGSVEVLPARPTGLPARFFDKAPATARVPVDSQGQPTIMNPAKISKPLWVFADQVSLQSVADKIHAAVAADRPIVIVGADESSIEQVFGQTLNSHLSGDVPLALVAWSWLPWMTQHLTEGSLGSSSGSSLSTEQGQALYYQFLVNSTLRLDSTITPSSS